MAGKTTNLQLQKIDDTDYAGNFPTVYNNNLDLIDGLKSDLITSVAGKQDKLIAGSGITIANDGKTISASNSLPSQRIPITNGDELTNAINNMGVGDRLVGDAISSTYGTGDTGINLFDLEKLDYPVNLGNYRMAFVVRKHKIGFFNSGNIPILGTRTNATVDTVMIAKNNSGIYIITRYGLKITAEDNITFDLTNSSIVSKSMIFNYDYASQFLFKNVFWLKY